MACCGRARQQATVQVRREPPREQTERATAARGATAAFEYTGSTSLVVIGPATGRRYVFDARLARVLAVDQRDRFGLRAVPHLRESRTKS